MITQQNEAPQSGGRQCAFVKSPGRIEPEEAEAEPRGGSRARGFLCLASYVQRMKVTSVDPSEAWELDTVSCGFPCWGSAPDWLIVVDESGCW